ncbi:MAG: phosphate-starvation-inducible PsiE family protein [Mucilaginibacter sp.]
MKWILKIIIYLLLILIVLCMILGTGHICVILFRSIIFNQSDYSIIDINNIYSIFSLILIVLVGHELFNAILHILDHKKIPVREIMQIAMIALGNKIITLDIKTAGVNIMVGLGVIIFSLGVSYFFFNKRNMIDNPSVGEPGEKDIGKQASSNI